MFGLLLPSASNINDSKHSLAKVRPARPPLWFLAGLLGVFVPLTLVERSFTAGAGQSVWTPALGIVFAIMVLYGTRWVVVLIATLLGVTAIASASKITDWALLTAVVAVLVAGYAIGAQMARFVRVRWSLRRLTDAFWLGLSAMVGTAIAIAAVIEVVEASGYLHGRSWWSMFVQGCASAGASTLAVAPFVLLAGGRLAERQSHEPARPAPPAVTPMRRAAWVAESVVLAGCFAGFANLSLSHTPSTGYYPMLIPLGWLALRRGIAGTSVGVAVGTLALSLFAHSLGLKVGRINQLEIFLLVFALCGLCFGSAQTERRDLENEAVEGRRALLASEAHLKILVERLREQANRDSLTHLPLKSLFVEYLVQAQARVQRSHKLIAVLYLDVDGFKCINDQYGHHVGDMAISVLADRLRQTVRDLDSPARAYEGGDEFLVLCDDLSNEDEAYRIASRITAQVASPLEIPGVGVVSLTASVGVAFAGPHDDPEMVVERADTAMLAAKRDRSPVDVLVLEP
ncbi:MAG TPA: diguanylate cyclase [Acidimicrobiales bacterium]|nr:diguanylate cyclase [Acidimicrobiales bacterium]